MPSTQPKRDVILKTSAKNEKSAPSLSEIIITKIVIPIVVIAVFYFGGCKIGLLPNGMCVADDLKANTPPLTPIPTDTPLPIALAPAVTQLPTCNQPAEDAVISPACGSITYIDNEQPVFACNANGTAYFTMKFIVSGKIAEEIFLKSAKGIYVETEPAGVCLWSSVTSLQQEGYFEAVLDCSAPSGTTVKILEALGGTSCEISEPCPQGFTAETSQLAESGKYYCVPENQVSISESCAPGTFIDETNQCCSIQPVNSQGFTCSNMQQTANGFSCDAESGIDLEILRNGFTMLDCNIPNQPRPTERPSDSNEEPTPTACVPDATGGGCP